MLNKFTVFAIYSEDFTDTNYHKRNSIRVERSVVKNKSETCIGCGALGSEVADSLGKAGIGKIYLIDKECIRAHNSVRHLVSIDRMGLPKALAVAEEIIIHNPFVQVINLNNYNFITYFSINVTIY